MEICNLDDWLLSLAPEAAGAVGEDGAGELGLELLGSMGLMQMSVFRVINPCRIGSLQSWNKPLAVELVGDAVAVDNGLLGLEGWDVGENGSSSRYQELNALCIEF